MFSLLMSVKIMLTLVGLTVTELLHFSNWIAFESVFIGAAVVAVWAFCLVVLTDPGLLPPRDSLEKSLGSMEALDKAYKDMYDCTVAQLYGPAGEITATLYECHACGVYKPTASTSHCSQCNGCVVGKDHHCVFLGTCVGVRNRAQFVAFLFSGIVALSVSFVLMAFRINNVFVASGSWTSLSTAEWVVLGLFGLLLLLKVVVFPFVLGYLANLQTLLVVFTVGLGAVIMLGAGKHLPWIPGLVAYVELCMGYFMASSLYYQIVLLGQGSTVRQLILTERGANNEELEELVGKQKIKEGKNFGKIFRYTISGFWFTRNPSYLA